MSSNEWHIFGSPLWSRTLPAPCRDVSVTTDGRVLLAACRRGLLEFSASGQLLSGWRPSRRSGSSGGGGDARRDDEDEAVLTAQVLSDDRVAVGLGRSRAIVLLMYGSSDDGAAWAEERRFEALQSSPGHLSVNGDHIAVAEARYNHEQSSWIAGNRVFLLSMSGGRQARTQRRGYLIWGVAAAADVIVTTSLNKVQLRTGVEAYVVDAYNHEGQPLWRFATDNGESVQGVCADSVTGRALYLPLWKVDYSSGRVVAVDTTDGNVLQRDVISFDNRLQPVRLSLSRGAPQRRVLAALCWDRDRWQHCTVTVYPAAPVGELSAS